MKQSTASVCAAALASWLGGATPAGAQCLEFQNDVLDGAGGTELQGATDVAVAPDGESLYATSVQGAALSVFARDPATGVATPSSVLRDGVGGVDGLQTARLVAPSPDGRHVYVAGNDGVAVFAELPASVQLAYVEKHGFPSIGPALGIAVSPDGRHVYATDGLRITIFARNASTGALTFVDSFDDGDAGAPLDTVQGIALSPDGAHVYAAASQDDALVHFSRDAATGLLTFVGASVDGVAGVDGLDFAFRVVVSPEGRHVYVSGSDDKAIAIFQRDGASLSFQEVVKDGIGGIDLQRAGALAISPDGLRLFVVAASASDPAPDEVVVFARNPATGSLRRAESRADGAAPEDLLDFVNGVAVSPDGRSVYVVSYADDGLTSYRWPDLLREVQIARDGEDGVEGLDSASYLAASPDGRSLYVAGFEDSAIAVFARDQRTGAVEFVEFERNGVGGVSSFDGPQGLTVSPDGKHLYATAGQSDAVAVFTRNVTTGALAFLQSHRDGFGGVDGLAGATTVLVSPDGKHVYVGGYNDGAVALFTRNATSGALTFVSSVFDGQGGADGLQGAGGLRMAMDRNGRHLYVPGSNEAALTVFERDAATGALAHVQTLRDGVDVGLIDFPSAVALSPDEGLVYVTSLLDDALTTFARDAGLGVLDELEYEIDGVGGVVDLVQPRGIAVADAGRRIYVATQMGDAIVAFDHDPALASTSFAGSVVDSACLPALDSASDVVAIQHFVYAASYVSDALVVLTPEPAGAGAAALAVLLVIGTRRRSPRARGGRC